MPLPPPPGSASRDNRNELLGFSKTATGQSSRSGISNSSFQNNTPSDMDQIQMQINKTTDESLDSTRRMVGLLDESQTVVAKTMENLYRQGEQLNRVEDNLDTMNQDMREAERNMEQMEKCCGLCVCPWRKRRNFEKVAGYQKTFNGRNEATGERVGEVDVIRMNQPNVEMGRGGNQQFITRITNDAREDEMDENMNAVSGMLGELKMAAVDMGQEIHKQNKDLDRLTAKTDVTGKRVETADKRANDILKKA